MTTAAWFVLIGILLITMGLRSAFLQRMRLTPSIVYLAIGVTLGPSLLGGMLFIDSWSMRAVGLALFLFVIVRPVSVFIGLLGSGTPMRLRMLVGWFGVRGIGSIYYLMFAIVFGLPEALAVEFIHITLVVIVLSIIIHGLTVKPMMSKWWP